MSARIDLTNHTFGRWTVLAFAEYRPGASTWLCECACGTRREVSSRHLRTGKTQSCGCYRADVSAITNLQHGYTRHPLYRLWLQMLDRCENPRNAWFHRYGGRGITVCERWHDFPSFCADMEPRPDGMTVDRINPDGPYSPDNCRWADRKQQAQTKKQTERLLTAFGKTKPLRQWCRELGLSEATVYMRLHRGWSVKKTLCTKAQKRH